MKTGEYENLDKALYIWFKQKREKNINISSDVNGAGWHFLQMMFPDEQCKLNLVKGFLGDFYQHHQLRHLVEHGEKLSADAPRTSKFFRSVLLLGTEL